jgi:hypothetical protein
MKTCGGGGITLPLLTSHAMEVSGHLHAPATLPPRKEPPDWIGGWMGTRAGLDAVETGINSCPCRKLTQDVQPVGVPTKLMVRITLRPHNPPGLRWVRPQGL